MLSKYLCMATFDRGFKGQLKPCRFCVCELFLKGGVDPDWCFILYGITFGFRVINNSLSLA